MKSSEHIESAAAAALRSNTTELDAIFVVMRPEVKTKKMKVLLGRHDGAPVSTVSLPQGNLGLVKWRGMPELKRCAEQTFGTYFQVAKQYDLVISEPFHFFSHEGYAKREKLLIYFRVDVPAGVELTYLTPENGFRAARWCDAYDAPSLSMHFATLRSTGKAYAHLEAVKSAHQMMNLAIAS